MSVKKAVGFFIGSGGNSRLNCGQAIAQAFKEKFSLSDEFILTFTSSGFGEAPGGVCGAVYAAQVILQQINPDKVNEVERLFIEHTSSLRCADIRAAKKISCVGCVKKAAGILDAL